MRVLPLGLLTLVLACQQNTPAATPPAVPEAHVVTGAEAKQLVAKGALLLDVRTPEEFEQLHLDGARNVPLAALAGALPTLPKTPIVVYCAVGGRSARAAETLAAAGFEVHNLGAMENWKK